jgi:hypothetical protein
MALSRSAAGDSYGIFISAPAACSGFPMRSASIFRPRSGRRSLSKVLTVRSFESKERERQDCVAHALRAATRLTPTLFSRVVTDVRTRIVGTTRDRHAGRLAQLVLSEAWTDASLYLVEAELPLWRVRHLIYDGGEWMCSLSRHPSLPVEFDPAAEGRHATMPVAILLSFVEAKGQAAVAEPTRASSARVRPTNVEPLCCDDFR